MSRYQFPSERRAYPPRPGWTRDVVLGWVSVVAAMGCGAFLWYALDLVT